MDFDFEEMYQDVILNHSRKPRNFGPLADATVTVSGDNPTCGDEIALSVKFNPQHDCLEGVGFTGQGCSICMASASMMTQKIKGKTKAEASTLWDEFQGMITGKTDEQSLPKELGDLRLLRGVRKFPQRVKCATLAWHALKQALAVEKDGPKNFSLDGNSSDL